MASPGRDEDSTRMPTKASYSVNPDAVAQARRLIAAHQYVLESNWGEIQPTADDENAFLESHSWDDYAAWHPRTNRRRERQH